MAMVVLTQPSSSVGCALPLPKSSHGFSHSPSSSSPFSPPLPYPRRLPTFRPLASNNPKGFGPPPKKKPRPSSPPRLDRIADDSNQLDDPEDDEVPEVVTNRMLKRIAFTVGGPLLVGVLFFPLFYYLKVVRKLDVPEWLPLITSGTLFGMAGLGITYGVVSTSWDPLREGSLLGWKEAQANLPVFLQTVQGKEDKK